MSGEDEGCEKMDANADNERRRLGHRRVSSSLPELTRHDSPGSRLPRPHLLARALEFACSHAAMAGVAIASTSYTLCCCARARPASPSPALLHLRPCLASSSFGCRCRTVSSHCGHGSAIIWASSSSNTAPLAPGDDETRVSRRLALLAVVTLTVPASHGLQSQRDSQALAVAVDDEKTKVELIQYELEKVLTKGKSAGVLRLAFHDAGTFDNSDNSGGMNGSILFELDRPESAGLQRPIKVLQKVKRELDLAFPVSWADLIAVAGAAAVAKCGGPVIPVKLGRLDSSGPDPEGKMPEETLSASALKQAFQSKGFTTQELVALSGAHTIGNKGFGNPNGFDNSYFQILLQKPWNIPGPDDGMTTMIGLATDRALADDEECLKWLKLYAADQGRFFTDFSVVYSKLVNTGARWAPPLQA